MVSRIGILFFVIIVPFFVVSLLLNNSLLPTVGLGLFILALPFVGRGFQPLVTTPIGLFLLGMATYFYFF